jgi:hypothetical protein
MKKILKEFYQNSIFRFSQREKEREREREYS